MAEAYGSFSEVYDTFMDNVPYREWAGYIEEKLRQQGIEEGLVLDLGCGTGSMTEELADAGYDMIGVDSSPEMLEQAFEKKETSGHDILYLLQDMRGFELYGTVRAVVSACDCVNYITDPEELLEVFRLVNNYLDPGGIFLFDFNTEYKYREVLGEQTIAEDREDCSFIWDNYYDEEGRINSYDLSVSPGGLHGQGGGAWQRENNHHGEGVRKMIRAPLSSMGKNIKMVHESKKRTRERIKNR